MENSPSVFIEKLDIVSLIQIFLIKNKISRVIIHETYACSNITPSALAKYKSYEFIIKLFFRGIDFVVVPEVINGKNLTWFSNQAALNFLYDRKDDLIECFWGSFLVNLFKTDKIIIALQNCLREDIAQKILFYSQCENLNKLLDNNLISIIPAQIDYLGLKKKLNYEFLDEKSSDSYLWIYRIKDICVGLIIIAEVLFRPLLELSKKGVACRSITPSYFDVAQQVNAGFNVKGLSRSKGMKNSRYDDSLWMELKKYNKSLMYVFGIWKFPRNIKTQFYQLFKEMGVGHGEELDNKIPLSFFLHEYVCFFSFNVIKRFLIGLIKDRSCHIAMLLTIRRILLSAVRFKLFLQYFRPSIFISRDDYSYTSCVRTIILNQYHIKNFGISHSQGTYPRHLPGSCFVHFDAYLLRGASYRKIFYPFWEHIKQMPVIGPLESDLVCRAKNDSHVKEEFNKKYGDFFNILIPISCPSWRNFREEFVAEKYRDLPDILELDDKIHLILRPRRIDAVDFFLKNFPKYAEYQKKGRISIELLNFTTYELLALCDLIISEDNSGTLFETICVDGAWPLAYAIRFDEYPLEHYNKLFVAYSLDDVKNVIVKKINHSIEKDVYMALEEIKKDYAPFGDDKSWSRVADFIVS
ncbi:MAG: hypothetical protein OEY01_06660 [Desulfobulbaceae bacterium]|nr:hypothetical protein [Desulfobulbaceae bacterium]